jgi:hypothetical protein
MSSLTIRGKSNKKCPEVGQNPKGNVLKWGIFLQEIL